MQVKGEGESGSIDRRRNLQKGKKACAIQQGTCLPCRYPPERRQMPYRSHHAFKTANEASVKLLLVTLSVVPLKRGPYGTMPWARGTCPLVAPPGIPSIRVPFRNTHCAQLHVNSVVDSLPGSHAANRRGRSSPPKPWLQHFLMHVPRV